jgi:hypothetical protein
VVAPPTPADIERLKAAAPRFGITLLHDWPGCPKAGRAE